MYTVYSAILKSCVEILKVSIGVATPGLAVQDPCLDSYPAWSTCRVLNELVVPTPTLEVVWIPVGSECHLAVV